MKTASEIEDVLARMGGNRPGPSETFWNDFRARARMYPQVAPARHAAFPARAVGWSIAVASALTVLLTLPAIWSTQESKPNIVRSLSVSPSYGAVFIMNDEPSKATILWIDDGNGG